MPSQLLAPSRCFSIIGGTIAAAIVVLSMLAAMAAGTAVAHPTPGMIMPTHNHVCSLPPVPRTGSATLRLTARRFLNSRGISYVIPRVPSGFPLVKAQEALRLAVYRFPVGCRPRVREMTFIAITRSPYPALHIADIVWAIFLTPAPHGGRGHLSVAFVETELPRPIGALP